MLDLFKSMSRIKKKKSIYLYTQQSLIVSLPCAFKISFTHYDPSRGLKPSSYKIKSFFQSVVGSVFRHLKVMNYTEPHSGVWRKFTEATSACDVINPFIDECGSEARLLRVSDWDVQ